MLLRSKRTVDCPFLEPSHNSLNLINHFTQIKNSEQNNYKVLLGTLFLFYTIVFLGSLQFKDPMYFYPKVVLNPKVDIIELPKMNTNINRVTLLTTNKGFMNRKNFTNIIHDFAEIEFYNKNRTSTHQFLCEYFDNAFTSIVNFKVHNNLTHQFTYYCPTNTYLFNNYVDIVIFRNKTIEIEKIKIVI